MGAEISRSEQKRRVKQLEELVAELSGLPLSLIDQLPCDEEIRTLCREAASMKGGARNRQVKYITRLLRDQPVDDLYSFLAERKGAALLEKKELHDVEFLRDALLNEAISRQEEAQANNEMLEEGWSSMVADEICEKYPGIDGSLLQRLAWMFARTRNRKHSRELFRVIRSAREQDRLLNNEA